METIDVEGTRRTDPAIVLDVVGIEPRRVLTRGAFARATRRLDEIPATSSTRLTFRETTNGTVRVNAFISERSVLPKGLVGWGTVGGRALILGDLKFDVSGALGKGEVLSSSFRWAENRPRVAFELAIPEFGPLPGVTRLEGSWERQSYALDRTTAGLIHRETRQRVGLGVGDWAKSWLAWQAGAALDRFDGRTHAALDAGIDMRLMQDHVSIGLGAGTWLPTKGGDKLTRGDISAAWRSTLDSAPPWSAILGTTIASHDAPLALWPGASAGKGRGVLLRAHPLHHAGIVTSEVFGRRMVYASVERQHVLKATSKGTLAIAGFVDTAKAWRRLAEPASSRLHVDVGTGLRINSPKAGGMVRLDVAYGLRDGEAQVSAGWLGRWPRR